MTDQIIVYRSRGEALRDEGFYDYILPWMIDHWYILVAVVVAFVLWVKVDEWRSRRRFKRLYQQLENIK